MMAFPVARQVSNLSRGHDFLEEQVGFEPTESCDPPVFKTGVFDHSTTVPNWPIMGLSPLLPVSLFFLAAFRGP
jgi:hypothetical protein